MSCGSLNPRLLAKIRRSKTTNTGSALNRE
jgi:hypothetical protein